MTNKVDLRKLDQQHTRRKPQDSVANLGRLRVVQMHPPLAASNVFLRM